MILFFLFSERPNFRFNTLLNLLRSKDQVSTPVN